MPLYPVIDLDPMVATSDFNLIPSGSLVTIVIDMIATTLSVLTLIQVSLTQDFSLRGWISSAPDGIPIGHYMPILRVGGWPIVVYVPPETPPEDCIPIAVESRRYYLNILNLTNEANVFKFSKADR